MLPASPRLEGETESVWDAGKGEKLPRCLCCGVIATKGNRLITFGLTFEGKPVGAMRLCERDYRYANPRDPREADPLSA
jgi:hypothetical protein